MTSDSVTLLLHSLSPLSSLSSREKGVIWKGIALFFNDLSSIRHGTLPSFFPLIDHHFPSSHSNSGFVSRSISLSVLSLFFIAYSDKRRSVAYSLLICSSYYRSIESRNGDAFIFILQEEEAQFCPICTQWIQGILCRCQFRFRVL